MALDESQENDMTLMDQGFSFTIEKELFDQVKPIHIDYVETIDGSGFQLTSNLPKNDCC
jgi:iron-sulfur cluster assembly protein